MVFSVASLPMWGLEFASCEKRQRGRWRPGWRYQEGPGRGFLFLLSTICQDSVEGLPRCIGHDVLILNASDDFGGPTAATTNFNIDIEYALESLGPRHTR